VDGDTIIDGGAAAFLGVLPSGKKIVAAVRDCLKPWPSARVRPTQSGMAERNRRAHVRVRDRRPGGAPPPLPWLPGPAPRDGCVRPGHAVGGEEHQQPIWTVVAGKPGLARVWAKLGHTEGLTRFLAGHRGERRVVFSTARIL